jgi:hypothetical protein
MSSRESIKTASYEDNIAGKVLRLTHDICEIESEAGLVIHKFVSWEGNSDIFSGLLGLAPAKLKVAPHKRSWLVESVMLRLDDEGEVKFGVVREGHTEYGPDAFLEHYYDMAAALFYDHPHHQCVEAYKASQPPATPLERLRDIHTGAAL